MKAELVNPFIESVQEIFTTMLGSQARRGKVGFTDCNALSIVDSQSEQLCCQCLL